MINISLAYVYQLAVNLEPLANLPREGRHADFIFPLFQAESALTALTQQSLFGPYLRTSWGHCQALLAELRRIADVQSPEGFEREVQAHEVFAVKQAYSECKIALLAEFGSLQSYFVTQKGGYDTVSLLRWGENLFPIDMPQKGA